MRTAGLLTILILLGATPQLVPAQAELDGNTASVIRALEHDWVEGQSRNDNRALNLIFDNAVVYVEYGQLVTKGEYLSRIRTEGPHPPQIAMEAINVRTLGDTAIAVGTYREKSANDGKILQRRWRFIDTWVNKKGRWILVAAAAAPVSK
jgi:ketosteroid isomerase-like protein